MPPAGHDPRWPDKAMFGAILVILAGTAGLVFRLILPLVTLRQDNLPAVFTDGIPGYTVVLCGLAVAAGVLGLLRQAAVFVYAGAACAIASLAVYGLVPMLAVLALVAMVKSRMEGEETHNDGIEMPASVWPDKALASSLFILVVAAVALLQGLLILVGRFDPILLTGLPVLAGVLGVVNGVVGLVASREVYHLRRPWLGWIALVGGLATMGFYLLGPLFAIVGMVLLNLAHGEDEFLVHGAQAEAARGAAARPGPRRRGRGRRPSTA